jgi:hypothetical protein
MRLLNRCWNKYKNFFNSAINTRSNQSNDHESGCELHGASEDRGNSY